MLFARKSAAEKRADFRAALRSGRLLRFPGAFSPLVARLIQRRGFEGIYISGAVLSADLALPDIGLTTLTEVAQRGRAITVPLLANMTEFGKTKLLSAPRLAELGCNVVIYPVTLLRLAMRTVEGALARLNTEGTQAGLLEQMQTREELYEVLGYADYNAFDNDIYNFKL